jgi:uncharacterized protein YhfF
MWPRVDGMRAFGLGPPGEMRDRLNRLVFAGEKISTAGLWKYDYESGAEADDEVGERQVMLDSDGRGVAVVEVTRVERHRFVDVPWEFARDEGEGFTSIEHWREGHRSYYAKLDVAIDDDDDVICVWFRVVERR